MWRFVRHGLWGLLVLAVGLLCLSLVLLASAPAVTRQAAPEAAALRDLQQLLRANDPRRSRPGSLHVLNATAADLNLLADYGVRTLGGAAAVTLGAGRLDLRVSLPVPRLPFGAWLNLDLRLGDGVGLPRVDGLQVGRVPLPGWLAAPVLKAALALWEGRGRADGAVPPLSDMVKGVRLRPERAQVVYEWRADATQRVLAHLLPPAQEARLHAYHDRLAEILRTGRGPLALPSLMTSLFTLAQERSRGGEAAAENRAALLTMALYVVGRPLPAVLPSARNWQRLTWRPVLLADRYDFPQHLLVSAALSSEAGGRLADALGLAKEVSDAADGSGFSFNDLAVNRAGTRLGEVAVSAPVALQARLAGGVAVRDLMPDVSDLPEFLSETAFVARYGGVGAPAYQRLLEVIEARIAALPLYR